MFKALVLKNGTIISERGGEYTFELHTVANPGNPNTVCYHVISHPSKIYSVIPATEVNQLLTERYERHLPCNTYSPPHSSLVNSALAASSPSVSTLLTQLPVLNSELMELLKSLSEKVTSIQRLLAAIYQTTDGSDKEKDK